MDKKPLHVALTIFADAFILSTMSMITEGFDVLLTLLTGATLVVGWVFVFKNL